MHEYILGNRGRIILISPFGRFTQADRASGICWIGCWVEPGDDLDASVQNQTPILI